MGIEQYLPSNTPGPWVKHPPGSPSPIGAVRYHIPGMAGMIVAVASGELIVSFSGVFPMTDTFCNEALALFFSGRRFIKKTVPGSFRGRYYSAKIT